MSALPQNIRLTRDVKRWAWSGVAILAMLVVFVVPFVFILFTAMKSQAEAGLLEFTPPTEWAAWENLREVLTTADGIVVRAFVNSTILTVVSVAAIVVLGAMVGYVLDRRTSRWNPFINFLVLAGLIVPPAIVPTIWVLQGLGIFGTLHGLILIQIAYGLSFSVLLFRQFVATIPRELDEAAIVDGAGPIRLFFSVIFPLLRSVAVTVTVVQSVFIYNDFVNPLYYTPGDENATVQLTLYNFQSQFSTQWNLLFMDILLITIPPLIMFAIANRKIVEGLTDGAVKG